MAVAPDAPGLTVLDSVDAALLARRDDAVGGGAGLDALDAGLPSLEAVHLAGVELALRGAVHDALLLAHLASFGARLRVRQRRCGHADEGKDEGEHEVFHGAAS